MSDSEDKKRNKLGYQRISIACGKHVAAFEDADRPLQKLGGTRNYFANASHSSLPPPQDQMPFSGE